jgi:hypothetical protein
MHEQRLVCRERCWITFFHLFANNGCIELRDVNMDLRRSVEVGSKNVFVNLRQPLLQIDSMKLVQKLSNKVSCFRNRHARNTVLADEKFKSGGGRSKQWQPQQQPECALVKALNYSTERIGQTWKHPKRYGLCIISNGQPGGHFRSEFRFLELSWFE